MTSRHASILAVAGVIVTAALAIMLSLPTQADDAIAANAVEQLQQQLDRGTARLDYADDGHGYLPGLLRALRISRDSQLLVFSASSLQFDHIGQKTPRALYYQDDTAVGSVQNGHLIEIITTDRNSGFAFYTLDTAKTDKPKFVRRAGECILCHGFASRWAPGMMVANMDTGPNGALLDLVPTRLFRLTDDRTPFEERYGGWYVTGDTGAMRHRGNVTLDPAGPATLPPNGLNIASITDRIDASRYLADGSDIVSLLTLEHQAGFSNLVARINAQYRGLDNTDVAPALRATSQDIDASIEELVRYMTFTDAVPLPSPVKGGSGFAAMFARLGPRDSQGRSLRDFDLTSRVFRYPLSYMIYSQAFDALNPAAKERVWRRLYDVLRETGRAAGSLPVDPRAGATAIAIVAATKSGLPDYWKSQAAAR